MFPFVGMIPCIIVLLCINYSTQDHMFAVIKILLIFCSDTLWMWRAAEGEVHLKSNNYWPPKNDHLSYYHTHLLWKVISSCLQFYDETSNETKFMIKLAAARLWSWRHWDFSSLSISTSSLVIFLTQNKFWIKKTHNKKYIFFSCLVNFWATNFLDNRLQLSFILFKFLTMHNSIWSRLLFITKKRRLEDLDKENNPLLIKLNLRKCFRCHKFNSAKPAWEVGQVWCKVRVIYQPEYIYPSCIICFRNMMCEIFEKAFGTFSTEWKWKWR